jgi:NAD(P)-dependent dehydrogenase (short-subunit alcohol dehydrogenase family)
MERSGTTADGEGDGMRHAVVTGGAKGIGLGVVRELAREGWRCTVFDADPAGRAAADEVGGAFAPVDVTRPEELRAAFADAVGRFGPLHGLVNSAGINRVGPSAELAPEDWQRVIDIDLSGTFFTCQAAYPHLVPGGAIVNVASVLATRALAGRVAYAAAKHGVVGITRVLAVEWAGRPIRVNAIAPSWTDTPLIRNQLAAGEIDLSMLDRVPFGRLAGVEEIVGAVSFLLSEKASFITGQTLAVDGGYTWAG